MHVSQIACLVFTLLMTFGFGMTEGKGSASTLQRVGYGVLIGLGVIGIFA